MREIKYIYKCDYCGKVLGENNEEHLSINLMSCSGWVKPDKEGKWRHFAQVLGGIYHFCDEICLMNLFKGLKEKAQ